MGSNVFTKDEIARQLDNEIEYLLRAYQDYYVPERARLIDVPNSGPALMRIGSTEHRA
jgi:hypothetical protein